jgi:alpha-maltose-1-phosphate synthase
MIAVPPSTLAPDVGIKAPRRLPSPPPEPAQVVNRVRIACPDARPPAYQAVVACAGAGVLDGFLTGYYHRGGPPSVLRTIAPGPCARLDRTLRRRHEVGIPSDRVRCAWSFDLAVAVERRLGPSRPSSRHAVARWRTRRFDRWLARDLTRRPPDAALIFSDVGSEFALPACRRHGITAILSMVHGDVREERLVLEQEAEAAPDFFPIYLGDGPIDREELDWLHRRRLIDIELADRILVPSEHIAGELERHGTPRDRISVIPYAADTHRFVPDASRRHGSSCTFLFAGGITQRKGIKYVLEAWRRVRRPGWRLQLLGALPAQTGPLVPYLDKVEVLGRVPHAEVPARMAAADVFVFPSLFEGSAVVTYEALACGLPSIVTAEAGSVVRDGHEGFIVRARDVEGLAAAMERLGTDAGLREHFSASARARAEAFDWPRYHAAVLEAIESTTGP